MKIIEALDGIHLGGLTLIDALSTVLLLIACVAVRRIVLAVFKKAMDKSRLDASIKGFLNAALGVLLWVLVVLVVADRLGIPVTSLVAIVSVAGLALSLSVQNILSNLFSGMTVLGTHPFVAGDWVDIGGTAGTVQSVGLFYTILKMPDGRTVHIPNSTVASSKVENFTQFEIRRIDIDVSASYDDPTDRVKNAIAKAMEMTQGLVYEPEPFVSIKEYGDSAIVYMVQVWAKTTSFFGSKCALLENIRTAFEENGVTMTYPHLNVHIQSGRAG